MRPMTVRRRMEVPGQRVATVRNVFCAVARRMKAVAIDLNQDALDLIRWETKLTLLSPNVYFEQDRLGPAGAVGPFIEFVREVQAVN